MQLQHDQTIIKSNSDSGSEWSQSSPRALWLWVVSRITKTLQSDLVMFCMSSSFSHTECTVRPRPGLQQFQRSQTQTTALRLHTELMILSINIYSLHTCNNVNSEDSGTFHMGSFQYTAFYQNISKVDKRKKNMKIFSLQWLWVMVWICKLQHICENNQCGVALKTPVYLFLCL